ncbi:MAG: hypothetical protein L0Y67_01410 [Gammaproteobacteria bacterium]|nr:hypothetical protein [Gammaproteobacteria bacterium]MCI0590260.1 hypothetical protein [Gammaproteobacteria bacterium]
MVKEEPSYLEASGPDFGAIAPANVGIFIMAHGPNETEVQFDEQLNGWVNSFPNGWGGRFLQRIE